MNRVERNLKRKRRRRKVFFSLFLVAILFVSALIATNNTMVQATGLSLDKNLFSAQRVQAYVTDKTSHIVDWIQKIDIGVLKQETEQLIKQGVGLLESLKDRWGSL